MTDNYFLPIDKPEGISSFDVIRQLRRITGIRKIGHTGTLDPFATGLIICCIGTYTRLATFVEAENKSYTATIKLGEKTNTGDTEGEVTETGKVDVQDVDWSAIQDRALCISELPVPAFSAVKINGKRAYSLAREGKSVEIPVRATKISAFQFIPDSNGFILVSNALVTYNCTVTKGTYIRSLSEWVAEQMGTVGHTVSLRRTSIGPITIEQAVKLDCLTTETWQRYAIDPVEVLQGFSHIRLDASQYALVCNGGDIAIPEGLSTQLVALHYDGSLIAVANPVAGKLHPGIVLK